MYVFHIVSVILSCCNGLMVKALTKNQASNELLLLSTEVCKVCIAFLICSIYCKTYPTFTPFRWTFVIASFCYMLVNTLSWWLLQQKQNIGLYFLLLQHRMLWILLFSVILLRKSCNVKQIASVILVLVGIFLAASGDDSENFSFISFNANYIALIFLQGAISAFASVWLEFMMKVERNIEKNDSAQKLYWFLNDSIHMYIIGLPFYLAAYYFRSSTTHTLSYETSAMICIFNALEGIMLGSIFVYYSAIWRGFQGALVIIILFLVAKQDSIASWTGLVIAFTGIYTWSHWNMAIPHIALTTPNTTKVEV